VIDIERDMLHAAKLVRHRLRIEAARLRAEEGKMILEATRDKVALPEHAWTARHIAEERARCANRLVEAMRP